MSVQYKNANKIVGMVITSSLYNSTGGTNNLGYSPLISKSHSISDILLHSMSVLLCRDNTITITIHAYYLVCILCIRLILVIPI